MTAILKLLLAVTSLAVCWYGMGIFGVSLWPVLFAGMALLIIASLFFSQLDPIATTLAKIMGGLSLVAFVLLLLASTVGGSSHMSQSNQVVAVALALMSVFGCPFFFIGRRRVEKERNSE
jgi:hypothetical protein